MTETEYLGAKQVCRSAYAVTTATKTTVYLGVCKEHDRPVRFDHAANLGRTAEILCPDGGGNGHRIVGERLNAVTTELECDGACRSAFHSECECGCGGTNHGISWLNRFLFPGQRPVTGALISEGEATEAGLEKWRIRQRKVEAKREQRREAAERKQRATFDTWAAEHQDVITALDAWDEHRKDDEWLSKHGGLGSHILVDFAIQTHGGWNGKPKALSEGQERPAFKILGELAERQRVQAEREANAKPAPEGKAIKISGEIVKVKCREGYMGGTIQHQAIVRCDGYAVQLTLPKPVYDWGMDNRHDVITDPDAWRHYHTDYDGLGRRWTEALRGTRIEFTAGELRRWENDETLAFCKRPSSVTFTPPEPRQPEPRQPEPRQPEPETEREAS